MTRAEYELGRAGLRSVPEKHYLIHGRMPHCEEHLNELLEQYGIDDEPEAVEPKAAKQAVEPKAEGQKPKPPAEPKKAEDKAPVKAPKSDRAPKAEGQKPKPPAEPKGDVEIPENLGTLRLGALKELAAKLGIEPVPNTQGELTAAIEAKRG